MKDLRTAWDAAKVKAGMDPDLHFHDRRRTWCSHMKWAHVDSFVLNEIMGHANPKIEATYTQIDYAQLVEAIAHVPTWHKSGTSGVSNEKGLQAQSQQPLDLLGAEGGICPRKPPPIQGVGLCGAARD